MGMTIVGGKRDNGWCWTILWRGRLLTVKNTPPMFSERYETWHKLPFGFRWICGRPQMWFTQRPAEQASTIRGSQD